MDKPDQKTPQFEFPAKIYSCEIPGKEEGQHRQSTSTVATVASSIYLPQSSSPAGHPDNISVRSAPAASAGVVARSPRTARTGVGVSQMSLLSTPRSPRRPRPQSLYVPFQGFIHEVSLIRLGFHHKFIQISSRNFFLLTDGARV